MKFKEETIKFEILALWYYVHVSSLFDREVENTLAALFLNLADLYFKKCHHPNLQITSTILF